MRLLFAANVVVAGIVGLLSLLAPETAARSVFQSTAAPSHAMTITGAFWTAIALLSVAGLFFPVQLSAVLLVQLVYKGLWLAAVAVPALVRGEGQGLPLGITVFFALWVLAIPFVYPWRLLAGSA